MKPEFLQKSVQPIILEPLSLPIKLQTTSFSPCFITKHTLNKFNSEKTQGSWLCIYGFILFFMNLMVFLSWKGLWLAIFAINWLPIEHYFPWSSKLWQSRNFQFIWSRKQIRSVLSQYKSVFKLFVQVGNKKEINNYYH